MNKKLYSVRCKTTDWQALFPFIRIYLWSAPGSRVWTDHEGNVTVNNLLMSREDAIMLSLSAKLTEVVEMVE